MITSLIVKGETVANFPAFSLGETVNFWICAVLMVLCALAMAFSKKAVHAAVAMVGVMIGLACLYLGQGAAFLGAAQIVVYTGAIMMLFLFVIMMVGVAGTDDYRVTSRGLRLGAWLLGLVLATVMIGATIYALIQLKMWKINTPQLPAAPTGNKPNSNPVAVALDVFNSNFFTLELVASLLIVAAIGAMLLTHPDRLRPRVDQIKTAEGKMLAYAKDGIHPGQLPIPGVYAQTNAIDVPAISGESGLAVEESVPRVLRVRGLARSLGEATPTTALALQKQRRGDGAHGLHGVEASKAVSQSGAWAMPGAAQEHTLNQPGGRREVAVPKGDGGDTKEGEDQS